MTVNGVHSKRHMTHLDIHHHGKKDETSASAKGKALKRDGDKIATERYDIALGKDDVLVTDRKTGQTVRVWGDPHLWTKDGDKAGFHDKPVTLDLADGTKITFKPTPRGADGKAFIDQVGVMNGDSAILVDGLHGDKPIAYRQVTAAEGDAAMDDGTVLRAGENLDDLVFAATGKELAGSDPNGMDGEFQLDGIGGESGLDFTAIDSATPEEKGDMYSRLFAALSKLQNKMEGLVDDIEGLADKKVKKGSDKRLTELKSERSRIEESLASPDKTKEQKAALQESLDRTNQDISKVQKELGDWSDTSPGANVEGELQKKQFELQQIQQLVQQYSTMMTNLSASDHQAKMAVISSLRK